MNIGTELSTLSMGHSIEIVWRLQNSYQTENIAQ